ncbi:MAG TPA: amidohydrolase, partial [Dehalococcoidia bacterium]|nr:amidohydrolase [Dehalococcoidia bacterium]
SFIQRPIPALARKYPDDPAVQREAIWLDAFGLDSEYDYDSFWRRCIELGVAVGAHGAGIGFPDRRSISSYVFYHMGQFGVAGDLLVRSLFLGGVTYRFPQLRVVLLEGGVTFGCRLFSDLVGHWEKRSARVIDRLNPERIDREQAHKLFREYGGPRFEEKLDQLDATLGVGRPVIGPELRDEFAACHIESVEDIRDRFIPNFYFGCEADDPLNAWAFNRDVNPLGAQIKTLLGSDIGHWDVPDMTEVLEEAYELVERGLLSPADFRAFACDNAIELYAGLNPRFFEGTVIEQAARDVLSESLGQSPKSTVQG